MAPAWFRLILSWIARHRQAKATQPPPLRRTKSFPVYGSRPTTTGRPSTAGYHTIPSRTGKTRSPSMPPQSTPITPTGTQAHPNMAWSGANRVTGGYPNQHVSNATSQPNPYLPVQSPAPGVYIPYVGPDGRTQWMVVAQHAPMSMAQVPQSIPVSMAKQKMSSRLAAPVPPTPFPSPRIPRSPKPFIAPPAERKTVSLTPNNTAPAGAVPFVPSPRQVQDNFARYCDFWRGGATRETLKFKNIPWPTMERPKKYTSLTTYAVKPFLLSAHHSQSVPAPDRVAAAQKLWDPDTFMARFGHQIREQDKPEVKRALQFLQGTLRMLYREVSVDDQSVVGSP